MENSTYFIVHGGYGAPIDIICMTKEELIQALEEEEYGEGIGFIEDSHSLPGSDYWPEDRILIIKGEVVVPKPKRVAKTYEL